VRSGPDTNRASRTALVSLLIAAGAAVYVFESAVPRPLPWIKPGLANVATLLALELFGFRTAAVVALGRVFVVSLVLGSFGNLAFAFSVSGAVCALLAMGAAQKWATPPLGICGVALTGATGHALGQLSVAWYFLVRGSAVLILLPSLLLSAAAAGLLVGLVSAVVLSSLRRSLAPWLPLRDRPLPAESRSGELAAPEEGRN